MFLNIAWRCELVRLNLRPDFWWRMGLCPHEGCNVGFRCRLPGVGAWTADGPGRRPWPEWSRPWAVDFVYCCCCGSYVLLLSRLLHNQILGRHPWRDCYGSGKPCPAIRGRAFAEAARQCRAKHASVHPSIPWLVRPGGGQLSSFIPSDRPRWASTSLISVSDFFPRLAALISSSSYF